MAGRAVVTESDVRVRDAVLHLRSVNGAEPEILIVHGLPESSVAWEPILDRATAEGANVHGLAERRHRGGAALGALGIARVAGCAVWAAIADHAR